jgi:hypothetical protein
MTASDTPSLVFRKTSFTMRERFTPARACSTLTRTCANLRLVCFSAAVSSPRGGFFFRLAVLPNCWFVPLKARIFVQDRPRWIGHVLLVGNLFLVRLTDVGLTQEADPLASSTDDDHVLVGMRFFLAAVVRGLFFRLFRPLPTPFRGIDDEPGLLVGGQRAGAKPTGVSLGQHAQIIEGVAEDRQQPVNPKVRPLLTQAEEFAHENLQGIRFEIDENEQQFLFRAMHHTMTAAPREPLAGTTSKSLPRGKERLIGIGEGRQEPLKLRKREPGEGQELPPIALEFGIGDHNDSIFTITGKV